MRHVLFALIGCFLRRWWGGWHVSLHWVKLVVGYVTATTVGFACTGDALAALAFGVVIGSALLNPFHSWGMGMGFDSSDKSTLACVAVMGGSYGAYSILAAGLVAYITGDAWFLLYAINGFLVPLPYLVAWLAFRKWPHAFKIPLAGQLFIDSPTSIGECFLGALLMGA